MRTETFSTPGPVEVEVRVPAGRVEAQTVDSQETVVELEPMRDNDASAAAVEDARVEMRERAAGGQHVIVEVRDERGRGFGFWRGAEVLARVRCPHSTGLEVEVASADVEARGRYSEAKVSAASGDVELEHVDGETNVSSASGDIEVERIGGRARVSTASGDVEIKRLEGDAQVNAASGDVIVAEASGPLAVNSASGDVVVRTAEDSVTVKTASGDQLVEEAARGELALQSASGDIRVGIRRGTKVWLDVRSRSGDTTSDLEVGDEPPAEGAPELELRAQSMSGDIHIGRA
jgi:DUF4097 and DUF4098 domain-containing protein YvlB